LRGLQAGARYRLRFNDHTTEEEVVQGATLMNDGLKVQLLTSNSSEIIFIEELTSEDRKSNANGRE
jgi:hypothetical protein